MLSRCEKRRVCIRYGRPLRCVSRCRIVIACEAWLSNDGRCFATVSSMPSSPLSTRIWAAAPVRHMAIDRMLQIVFFSQAISSSRSRSPNTSCRTMRRFLMTSSSPPTITSSFTYPRTAFASPSSASADMPWLAGLADGNGGASVGAAAMSPIAASSMIRFIRSTPPPRRRACGCPRFRRAPGWSSRPATASSSRVPRPRCRAGTAPSP